MHLQQLIARIGAAVLLAGVSSLHAENVDPDGTGKHWVWSENAGWVNAQPSGVDGPGLHAGNSKVTGWLWSANIGWISAHCSNTASCGQVDYGLRLQPDPEKPGWLLLVGKAWSENAGWIISHCLETGTCDETDYGLRVNLSSGEVQGFAWSENMGWLSFSCAGTGSCGSVDFGLKFDPDGLLPATGGIFKDSFESIP